MYAFIAGLTGDYTRLFFTVSITQIQFLMAAILFALPIPRKKPLWPRMLASLAVWLPLMMLAVYVRTRWPGVATRLSGMLINISFTLPILFLLLEDNPFTVLSTWCAAVAAEEIVATAYDVIMACFDLDTSQALFPLSTGDVETDILLYLLMRFCMTGLVYLAFGRHPARAGDPRSLRQLALLSTGIVLLIAFFSTFTQEHRSESLSLFLISRSYALAFAFLILLIRSGIIRQDEARQEISIMEQVLREERKQYEQNRENIQLINMRCHDLKHQLSRLAGRLTDEEVRSLQEAMNIYDAAIKTGSEVLDVVIYENQLACQKENIQLSCMADGAALSFMRTRHIYALFSNALRNAMEAVRKLEDPQQRIISIHVEDMGDHVEISVINYYAGEVNGTGGTLNTTKGDMNHHGFGTMSMKYITDQYGGHMGVDARGGVFRLFITIPKPGKP